MPDKAELCPSCEKLGEVCLVKQRHTQRVNNISKRLSNLRGFIKDNATSDLVPRAQASIDILLTDLVKAKQVYVQEKQAAGCKIP